MRGVQTFNGMQAPQLRGGFISDWEQSAVHAMQAEPLYFARWYTVKSIALVGVSVLAVGLAVKLFSR